MTRCSLCGNEYTPQQIKENSPNKRLITFSHNGQMLSEEALPYDSSFFEITKGKYKGNLVHIFDIVSGK